MATFAEVLSSAARLCGGQLQGADIAAELDRRPAGAVQLEWRYSIVDLMKALELDSGLAARAALAQDLGYPGPLNGSAEMNIWLHRRILSKLAESGAKMPKELIT